MNVDDDSSKNIISKEDDLSQYNLDNYDDDDAQTTGNPAFQPF